MLNVLTIAWNRTEGVVAVLAGLATGVAVEAVRALSQRAVPDASVVGIVVATLSLLAMPALARAKRRLAANALAGWWADPLAGLGIVALAAREAVNTWRAEALEDTCCA